MNQPTQSTTQATGIRFVAEYQLFGDSDGRTWMQDVLTEARRVGSIQDFEVTGSHPGSFGLQLVTFTIDVPIAGSFEGVDYAQAREVAANLLNEIVGDSDTEIRWASPFGDD